MIWVYEVLVIMAMASCSLYMYWKTRLKCWILLALGLFLYFNGILILQVLHPPSSWVMNFMYSLELIISMTMVAVGLGLALKGMWDNYRMKPKNSYTTVKN